VKILRLLQLRNLEPLRLWSPQWPHAGDHRCALRRSNWVRFASGRRSGSSVLQVNSDSGVRSHEVVMFHGSARHLLPHLFCSLPAMVAMGLDSSLLPVRCKTCSWVLHGGVFIYSVWFSDRRTCSPEAGMDSESAAEAIWGMQASYMAPWHCRVSLGWISGEVSSQLARVLCCGSRTSSMKMKVSCTRTLDSRTRKIWRTESYLVASHM